MRIVSWVVAVAVALGTLSLPRDVGANPTIQEVEIQKLEKEFYELQGKQAYVPAVKIARKLYEAQKKITGDGSVLTQRRKQALASALQMAGAHAEAIALYTEMLRTVEKDKGVESREAMYALMPLVGLYWQQNRVDDLEPIYHRLLTITKKLDGEQSIAYAQQLNAYATLLNARNEYSSALRLYEQALAIHEALAKTKDDISLVSAMSTLGAVYWQSNQRAKAIAIYDRMIKILDASSQPVMTRASMMWGVAAMYHYGEREDLARPLSKRVVDMFQKEIAQLEKANPDDPQIVAMLGQLGMNYRQLDDLANADKVLSRAVSLEDKRGGFSGYSSMLADIRRAQGKPKEALALLEKAQAALTKIAPSSATAYNTTIADVLRELREFKRAEALLAAHTAYLEKTYGKKHPVYGMTLMGMARIYMASGKLALAEKMLAESLEISEKELTLVLKTGTEADHAVYFARNGYQLDSAIDFEHSYAPGSTSAARLGLTTLLRRKGRVLDAAAASLATIRSKLSADDKKLLDDLSSARTQLAKLTVAGPTATGAADYAKEIAALEDQIQKLELQVGKKSAAYRVVSQPIVLAGVQKLIPKDARLVELVNFTPSDPKAPYQPKYVPLPRRYAAYVVGSAGDPVFIDLGGAAAIDAAVEKFRKALSDPSDAKAVVHGRALYDLTMAKVIPQLNGATSILIAPDGTLNVVPFSALVDDRGEFLIKRFTFTYLTSGRDLLRLNVKTVAQGGGVIFADPSFDGAAPAAKGPNATPNETPNGTKSRGSRSVDLASLSWPALPGTGAEATEVEKTMRGMTVFRGARATEGELKRIHGPRILHLATHGFFLPDEPPPKVREGAPAATEKHENPLLRSGLAFAGANKLSSGTDDGILTAMEASGLDLWGTKLVVLSACETGAGKVTNGDGVYGLRRALVIAGAESLVMSLWQVDDEATKELMAGYYKRLTAGKPRSAALRDVQLEIHGRPQYAHPYFWASFLPAGDNTPLTK
ncbi:MAG: tetratricopeptide repeat protein [Myxococcales bacterium]|nr:tetratricopeptide repeat protein [Myxococcales bacterium]